MKQEIYLFYKTIDFKEFNEILNIIENIPDIKLDYVLVKNVSRKNGVKIETDEKIMEIEKVKEYLEAINSANFIELYLKIPKTNSQVSLTCDFGFLGKYWSIQYNESAPEIDAFVYNVKKVFRPNLWSLYNCFRNIILMALGFISILFHELKNERMSLISTIFFLIIFVDVFIRRKKAYKKSYFVKKHKDEIMLNVIFYILGVITPYIIQYIIKIFIK